MKRILRVLLIIVVVLCAAYFFLIDHIIKAVVESEGSKLLTAKLDIGRVTFHILPTSIQLDAVQITNPQQPARNIIEFASVATPLNINALLAQTIDLPEIQLHGLRFNTSRSHSGAIAGLTPVANTPAAASAMPDAAQIMTQQKQNMHQELNKAVTDLRAIRDKWQQRLQQLPDDNRIEAYRQREILLRQTNKTAELSQLQQELNNELGTARKLAGEYALDMEHARAQLGYANALPQQGFGNLGSGDAQLNNAAGVLLGGEFSPLFTALTQQINGLIQQANTNSTPAWRLLVRRAILDGQLDLGAQPVLFAGTLDNFTPQPKLWNVATRFALDGVATQTSKLNARGTIDLRKTPSIDIRFDLREFPVQDFSLTKNPPIGIAVKRAVADIQGLLALTGNQIDVNVLSRFQQASLTVDAGNDTSLQVLIEALRDVRDFDLNLQISGAITQPMLKLDSSLNQRIAAALRQQMQTQPNVSAGGSSSPLQQELAPDMAIVQQLSKDFESLTQQLAAKQTALQNASNL